MIRLALSGCGAVANLYYTAALEVLGSEVGLVAVFDPDSAAAANLAAKTGAEVASSFHALVSYPADIVLVLSPPAFHCEQTCQALEAGRAVLCEKPMALTMAEAERMKLAARNAPKPLGINMVRRLLPQAGIIKSLIKCGALGILRTIDIFEGGPFDWPIASPRWFAPGEGGGVLDDIGVHVLDLLRWWLGEPNELEYRDDEMGGAPANCAIGLRFGATRVKVRLSRDWYRPNGYRLTGDDGWLHWPIHDQDELTGQIGSEAFTVAPASVTGYPDALAQQIRALAAGKPTSDPDDGLKTMMLLQRCRDVRAPMAMEWL